MRCDLRQSLERSLATLFAAAAIVIVGLSQDSRAAETPRETPLSPADELATFQLADPRLTVELVASEPELDSPVAVSWDADGKLYVAEMIDYPVGPTSGRVRLLEDRDGDGRYEHASVFAAGLNFPNGVLAARGGVFVTAAPDILFLKDNDGDGQADEKRVVFTGFGEGNQQLRANGLTWGLDNWIYGANGRSDGNVRRPTDPPEKAVSIRTRDFRFRPDGSQFEATSGQSQFGQAHDDWGNRFLSWNTIPIRQALFDQAFLDRNPRLSGFGVRDLADELDTGQVFPLSPRPQTFNRERTDFYNALCGLTIFRGDALGPDYVGNALVGESLTNLVHRRVLTPEGPTFISRRGEHNREFLAAKDSWFHPVYMATGPDGALYIVDFYRRWVEHPAFVAESLRPGVDFRKGAGHGRLWKVSRRENTWPPRPTPRMSRETTVELVKHLESPNGWRRDTAQRLLVERQDPAAVTLLRGLRTSRSTLARLHALCTLDAFGQVDEGTLLRALDEGEVRLRAFALRSAGGQLAASPRLRASVMRAADFPSSLLRFQVALSLGAMDGPEKIAMLAKLANLEVRDSLIPLAIVGGLGRDVSGFLKQLTAGAPNWRHKPTAEQMRFLSQVAEGAGGDNQQIDACLALIASTNAQVVGPGDLAILAGLAQGLADIGQSPRVLLDASGPAKSRVATVRTLLAAARRIAVTDVQLLAHRLTAIDVLGQLDAGSGPILLALLDAGNVQELQSAAATALGHADGQTAAAMFKAWPQLTTTTRRTLVSSALRSSVTTAALVDAMEADEILPRELETSARDGLLVVRDPALQARIKPLVQAGAAAEDRQAIVDRFAPLAKGDGDRQRGAAVFEKQCSICHSVQGRGQRVGPDLSGIGARPKETLLVDLFDPSRQVPGEYVAYTLVTRQGQVLTGLVISETAGSVTLRRAEGAQDVVLRDQVEELRRTGKSLMPEGLEQSLSEENVADLLAFLALPDARLFSQPK